MEIGDLPAEMVMEVHQRLPPSALKMAVLVNKLWRKVGEEPSLWEWCKVTVYNSEDITNLAIRRLQRIQEISINPRYWDTGDWEAFFLAIMELPCLKKIDWLRRIGFVALRDVDPGLFARSLARLKDVDVSRCTFTQIEELFTEMTRDTRVKKLSLSGNDMSQMDPGLFAGVLAKLEDVSLLHNKTTREQMQALLTKILDQTCLKRLKLYEDSVYHMDCGLLVGALAKIEDVTMNNSISSINGQIEQLFRALAFGTQVKTLSLSDINLSQVDPGQFSRALSRLEEVSMDDCRISNAQKQALFIEISLTTPLKKLHLRNTNLSQLNPGLFSRVLASMEDVLFYGRNPLTTDQLVAFFTEAARSTRLKILDINGVNLSTIDPEVLSQAVIGLEAVELGNAHLTPEQALSLFTEMSRNTQIKKLEIVNSNVSSVTPEILAAVLNRLDEVQLYGTGITRDQALAFFTEMSSNTNLKKLDLELADLSTIDPEVLGGALIKLKEVSLIRCDMSTVQINTTLACVLGANSKIRKLYLGTSPADINPEIVRNAQDKLKGELIIWYENDE